MVTDRRQHQDRRRSDITSQHFICPACPFEGDEQAMIDHAQLHGHVAVPDYIDISRMSDGGCPND